MTDGPSPLPQLTDEALERIEQENLRPGIAKALKLLRVGKEYFQMEKVGQKVADMAEEQIRNAPDHIAAAACKRKWTNMGLTVETQKDWMLRRVIVSDEEVNEHVTRWLLLKFSSALR